MKRDLSFGSLLTTISAAVVGFGGTIYAAFFFLGLSMNSRGEISNPEMLIGTVGCVLLIVMGLVATILAIIGIFKKGKGLAIATLVFQAILIVSSILAMISGFKACAGLAAEELIVYGSTSVLPFVGLFIAHAGAFVLNLFNVLRMKKEVAPVVEEVKVVEEAKAE